MDWPWSETTVSVSTSPYKPTALLSPQLSPASCVPLPFTQPRSYLKPTARPSRFQEPSGGWRR
jgi:hypothetical protein